MRKKNFIIATLAIFLFAGCNNATNNINRARNSTFDFIGRFFNNWENGRVTDDRYDSHNNFDDTML